MANARKKTVDGTHLSIDTAEDRLLQHRDYVSHCIRWSVVANRLGRNQAYKTARVLDVGCGVDIPMGRMLYSNRLIPLSYTALDYNSPDKFKMSFFERGKFPIRAFGGVDFATNDVVVDPEAKTLSVLGNDPLPVPNVVTCFEVVEHVEPEHAVRILRKVKQVLDLAGPSAKFYMSTPCYDAHVGPADNHVSEIKRDALGATIENLGFCIEENFGVFASQRDYRDVMFAEYPHMREVWDRLKNYYDSNMMAILFAPLYPAHARNNFWVLSAKSGQPRKFPQLSEVAEPWTSSDEWRGLETSLEPSAVPAVAA